MNSGVTRFRTSAGRDYFTERDIKILTTIATLIGNKTETTGIGKTLAVKQQELVNINEQLAEAKLSALQADESPFCIQCAGTASNG